MMHAPFGQVPDPSGVMDAAAATGSWAIVLLCFLVVTLVGGFVVMVRMLAANYEAQVKTLVANYDARVQQLILEADQQRTDFLEREKRMAGRIDTLEDLSHSKLTSMLERMLEVMGKFEATLAAFTSGQNVINGDLKRLCGLLEGSPCLVLAKGRGAYKVVDKETGEEITG